MVNISIHMRFIMSINQLITGRHRLVGWDFYPPVSSNMAGWKTSCEWRLKIGKSLLNGTFFINGRDSGTDED